MADAPYKRGCMTDITIRNAIEADVPAIRDLLVTTWHATYDHLFGVQEVTDITSRWHTPERIRAVLDQPQGIKLVAEQAGIIVGTLHASRIADSTVALHRLYVLPTFQGHGVGKALHDAMTAHFGPVPRTTLEVEPRNTGAIAFYEKMGFRAVGGGNACGGDKAAAIDHLIMERRA